MAVLPGKSSRISPQKHVSIGRGNNRVTASVIGSPTRRLAVKNPKISLAMKHSRRSSNPLDISPSKAPKQKADDEWQDIEPVSDSNPNSGNNELKLYEFGSQLSYKGQESDISSSFMDFEGSESSVIEHNGEETVDYSRSYTSFMGFSPSGSRIYNEEIDESTYQEESEGPHTPENRILKRAPVESNFGHKYHGEFATQYQDSYKPNRFESLKRFWLDPGTPGLLALYLQVVFNMAVVGAVLYGMFAFYQTIRNDVNLKVEEYSVDVAEQISVCAKEYVRNGCDLSKRAPVLEVKCHEWEMCMQRSPQEVGRAKVGAETFGIIIEAFLKPISLKSIVFIFALFGGSFLLVNAVFSSRIGPRFSMMQYAKNSLNPANMIPTHQMNHNSAFEQQSLYQPESFTSGAYSSSPIAMYRSRRSQFHPGLQSSPAQMQYYQY